MSLGRWIAPCSKSFSHLDALEFYFQLALLAEMHTENCFTKSSFSIVPDLNSIVSSPRSGLKKLNKLIFILIDYQDCMFFRVNVDTFSADVRTKDALRCAFLSSVPKLDSIIPAAGDKGPCFIWVMLQSVDCGSMPVHSFQRRRSYPEFSK